MHATMRTTLLIVVWMTLVWILFVLASLASIHHSVMPSMPHAGMQTMMLWRGPLSRLNDTDPRTKLVVGTAVWATAMGGGVAFLLAQDRRSSGGATSQRSG